MELNPPESVMARQSAHQQQFYHPEFSNVFAERGVPTFDGTLSNYKDYRRRAKLFIQRKRIEKKVNEALVHILSGLTKEAWDCVEELDMESLEEESQLEAIWDIMDRNFKYDERTEVPTLFEELFTQMWRQRDQTLMEYTTQVEKKIRKLKEVGSTCQIFWKDGCC